MIKLSKRLKTIAQQIEIGQTMADVGTDHGFLSLYLWENGQCSKVIMTDISAGSLQKAIEAFERRFSHSDIHFRLGDGLAPIEEGEVDVVVIAGVGGVLMTHIFESDLSKTASFRRYILQPRNGSGKLRYWLDQAGFKIVSESLAEEGKRVCEILVVEPPQRIKARPSLDDYPDEIKYEMPRNLAGKNEKTFKLFINEKLNIEKQILKAMIDGKTEDIEKKSKIENRIKFLEQIDANSGVILEA